MSTTMEVANRLVALCKEGKFDEVVSTLLAEDVVSVEAAAPPGMQRESRGREAVKQKGEWWTSNHEVHSFDVTGPWPHDDRFIVGFRFDVTFKPESRRFAMDEAALYTVKDGKIVREEFFYDTSGM